MFDVDVIRILIPSLLPHDRRQTVLDYVIAPSAPVGGSESSPETQAQISSPRVSNQKQVFLPCHRCQMPDPSRARVTGQEIQPQPATSCQALPTRRLLQNTTIEPFQNSAA